jgi:putative oxidoreductase
MKKITFITYWLARIIAALIMLQTLYFKFTAAPESVYIFTTVGMEPWGRITVGALELIASVLLLVPGKGWIGAMMALFLMLGAIAMHLTFLGVSVQNDHGYLFFLAVAVAVCSLVVLYTDREIIQSNFIELKRRLS